MQGRKRASAACRQCRASKVRCDVAQTGIPCSRCQGRNADDCQLLPSRRGLHHQNAKRRRRRSQIVSDQADGLAADVATVSVDSTPKNLASRMAVSDVSPNHDDTASAMASSAQQQSLRADTTSPSAFRQRTVSLGRSQTSEDPSWVSIFETLLKSREDDARIENASITFLGESFPLTHLLGSIQRRGGIRMHHPIAQDPESLPTQHDHPTHLSEEDVRYLVAKECLSLPPEDCLRVLISAFTKHVHPLYPVVILQDFLDDYATGSLPMILLHAACCAASSFCSLAELTPLGFVSSKEARDTFYRRAKLLFDLGYETDKIVVLQSTTLMTFWPSGPQDIWTFYHWIGFSVTLAESLGIHRSMAHVNMPAKKRSLLRRIWCALAIRDVWGAALFGRPLRINGLQCDADLLNLDDFRYDATDVDDALVSEVWSLYFIRTASLAGMLRSMFILRSSPQSRMEQCSISIEGLRSTLADWRASVPLELDWDASWPPANVYAEILSVLYHHTLIMAHLPISTSQGLFEAAQPTHSSPLADGQPSSEIIRDAAEAILNVGTLLVTQNELLYVPHELFTGIFLAQVLLFTNSNAKDQHASKLAKSQMTSFQMILHQVKAFWEPASWIMHLFKVLSEKPKEADLSIDQTAYDWADDAVFSGDSFVDIRPYLGDLSIFDSAWPSHPTLSSLFEG